ncbi:MAG TPA: glutathionylspermidine synthase family protein [Bryobacteraceae bacterium]|jgi:glutathionylspermidine synthase|nr:glutathionylspermidine synthase family protein [Bryobacteraceae bacterium]
MRRETVAPRAAWQDKVSAQGLTFHTPDGQPYWDESICYRFRAGEVDQIEAATNDLQELCLKAAQHVIDNQRYAEFHIPPAAVPFIEKAWNSEPPSIYGRFDLAFDGRNPPKMLEYNANTPTSLIEASVIQWYWLQDMFPKADQFNSVHEKLIAQWKEIRPCLRSGLLYFTSTTAHEDVMTLAYLKDVAAQAGVDTTAIAINDIGWNDDAVEFRDLNELPIRNIFALYPWEWLLAEYPEAVLRAQGNSLWIEPIWKMLWSNKALLAILWELFPEHPNLLETHLDDPGTMREYVRKPILSREGSNIFLRTKSGVAETGGPYGDGPVVYQAAARTLDFDGKYPVIGSWLVTDQGACGIGIRESDTPITDNRSRFVPHYFTR